MIIKEKMTTVYYVINSLTVRSGKEKEIIYTRIHEDIYTN